MCNAFSLAGYTLHEHRQIGTLVKMYCTYKTHTSYILCGEPNLVLPYLCLYGVSSDNVSPNINSGVASDSGAAC